MKFLDLDGLSYFTTKILAKIPAKISELTNDLGLTKVNSSSTNGNILIDDTETTVYTLPNATTSTLGGVKVGTNVSVSSGTISVKNGTTSQKGVVQLTDSTSSASTTTAATPNSVSSALSSAKSYADDLADGIKETYLPLSGGTMTGSLSINTDSGNSPLTITRLGYPSEQTSIYQIDNGLVIDMINDESTNSIEINMAATDEENGGEEVTNQVRIASRSDGSYIQADTFYGNLTGNADSATKATQDSSGQQINTTYIKGLSVSGKTITYTKGDDTTGTITTQDTNTTYSAAGSSLGLVKSGGDVTISSGVITVNDDSHAHVIDNVDGLQDALDKKITNNPFAGNGSSGVNGYIAFAQLVITSNYVDRPIEFELISRRRETPCYVSVSFTNLDNTDPTMESLLYWGTDYGVFAHKTDTSTWLLYATKAEAYDVLTLARIQAANQNITITHPGTIITEKPSDAIDAVLGGNIGYATSSAKATSATYSTNSGTSTYANKAASATSATYSAGATTASKATSATSATYSSTATYAKSAPTYKGATTASSGTAGFVPAATTATRTSFLRGDGTWATPSNATSATKATSATMSTSATYATNSGTATYATNSGTATYSSNGAKATSATSATYASTSTKAGTSTYSSKASSATSATYSSNATNSDTLDGYHADSFAKLSGAYFTGNVTIHSGDMNGAYNGLLVGDDCYIGDCNISNTIGLMGATDNNIAYIKLGKNGGSLGYNGSNLVYNNSLVYTGQTITYGTGSLTAGSSGLATGNIYLQYE